MTCVAQKAFCQAGAERGIAPRGGNAQNLDLRTLQRQGDGESIVDVVADIRIDDQQLWRSVGWRTGRRARSLVLSSGGSHRAHEYHEHHNNSSDCHLCALSMVKDAG